MRRRFEEAGGLILERTAVEGVEIHPNGVALRRGEGQPLLTGRLLIDCMGNASPLVRQVCSLSRQACVSTHSSIVKPC